MLINDYITLHNEDALNNSNENSVPESRKDYYNDMEWVRDAGSDECPFCASVNCNRYCTESTLRYHIRTKGSHVYVSPELKG